MPSVRSESRPVGEDGVWGLALLVTATLFLTSQALAIGFSERLLLALLITLALSVWVLQLLAGWRGIRYLKALLIMLLLGLLGMLSGALLDFGAAGLVMLTAWCSTLGGSGLGSLWSKLGIAPWSYAGMWIGCNLGMLLSACHGRPATQWGMSPWQFRSLSNLGMLLGLLAMEAWQPVVSGSLQNLAALMLVQMLLSMVAGMALVWWLAAQLDQRRLSGMPSMPRSSD